MWHLDLLQTLGFSRIQNGGVCYHVLSIVCLPLGLSLHGT